MDSGFAKDVPKKVTVSNLLLGYIKNHRKEDADIKSKEQIIQEIKKARGKLKKKGK